MSDKATDFVRLRWCLL